MGNCFWCYSRQLFVSLALKKGEEDCNIPKKMILVQGFFPLKTEIARFPIGFRLSKCLFKLLFLRVWVS